MPGYPGSALNCADVRAEFIEALVALNNVTRAAAKCGIGRNTLYRARQRFPDFAAAWHAARDGVAGRGSKPVWVMTVSVREAFIAALGEGFSIARAAKLAKVRRSAVYNLKYRDADFAAEWARARAEAAEQLESLMVERVIHGVERTVFVGGEARQVRHFDMAAGLRLLERRAAAATDRPRGRIIELTPESVAIARRKVVALLTGQGIAAFEP